MGNYHFRVYCETTRALRVFSLGASDVNIHQIENQVMDQFDLATLSDYMTWSLTYITDDGKSVTLKGKQDVKVMIAEARGRKLYLQLHMIEKEDSSSDDF